jgi:hypothetical protein
VRRKNSGEGVAENKATAMATARSTAHELGDASVHAGDCAKAMGWSSARQGAQGLVILVRVEGPWEA